MGLTRLQRAERAVSYAGALNAAVSYVAEGVPYQVATVRASDEHGVRLSRERVRQVIEIQRRKSQHACPHCEGTGTLKEEPDAP